jgi:probable F420-dependent oxidoreductase
MPKIVFGPQLPTAGRFSGVDAITTVAEQSEAMGFSAVWMRDHIERDMEQHLYHSTTGFCEEGLDPGDPNIYESLTTMAYLSRVTKSVKIGVCILLLPQRDPVVTAKQIATVDQLSRGRLIVGLGVGNVSHRKEMEILHTPYKERGDVQDEYIQVMKEIWTKPMASYQGKYVEFSNATIYPKPFQKPHPPLLIGGKSPRALRRVAELGDGWVPFVSPQEMKQGVREIKRLAAGAGRGNKDFMITHYAFPTSIATTHEEAERRFARGLQGQRIYTGRTDATRQKLEDFKSWAVVGTPDEVIKRIGEYVDAGATYFEHLFNCSTQEEMLRMLKLFSREVIPSFT